MSRNSRARLLTPLTRQEVPFETVIFAEHPIYSDPPSEETNAAWEGLTEGK